jgi:hypothetical protein
VLEITPVGIDNCHLCAVFAVLVCHGKKAFQKSQLSALNLRRSSLPFVISPDRCGSFRLEAGL